MNQNSIQAIVKEVVERLSAPASSERKTVPIAISARHCHLSKEDVETLFGHGYELTVRSELSQPSQFAANETVVIAGPRGSIEKVRILGPARSMTQVEVSQTDSIKLGLKVPLRISGDIADSAPITIIGPKGSIFKKEGCIVARAHIHMTPEDARAFNVNDGECVRVTAQGERPVTFEKIMIRVSGRYKLEMHIDTDEANAGLIFPGQEGVVQKYGEQP
jgi:putative phosphotransacetylase